MNLLLAILFNRNILIGKHQVVSQLLNRGFSFFMHLILHLLFLNNQNLIIYNQALLILISCILGRCTSPKSAFLSYLTFPRNIFLRKGRKDKKGLFGNLLFKKLYFLCAPLVERIFSPFSGIENSSISSFFIRNELFDNELFLS